MVNKNIKYNTSIKHIETFALVTVYVDEGWGWRMYKSQCLG